MSLLSSLARFLARAFYQKIEVEGLSKLPLDRPLLIVGNHGNALIDPMLLLGFLPVPIRFLAKSTLWSHPVVKHLVRLTRAIPIQRRHDPGSDTSLNSAAFAACYEVLRDGGAIAMFPEGISHTAPHLMPLKTGAARIVLEAERLYGPLGIRIVPVGLLFQARGKFRSAVLIKVGTPIDLFQWSEHHESQDSIAPRVAESTSDLGTEAVREVTAQIDLGLRGVTLNYESWEEARLIERAAEIYRNGTSADKDASGRSSRFEAVKTVLAGYQGLREEFPREVEHLAERTRDYDRLLNLFALKDVQVASAYPPGAALRFTIRSLASLFLWLPLAVLGTLLNWLPYRVPGWLVRSLELTGDVEATYRVLTALVVFPSIWALEATVTAKFLGTYIGLATAIVAPVTGYVALRFFETGKRFTKEVRAFLVLRWSDSVADDLKARRLTISSEMKFLVERARSSNLEKKSPGQFDRGFEVT